MKTFRVIVAIATLIMSFSACERVSQIMQPTASQIESDSDEVAEAINNAESKDVIAIREALANIKDLDTIFGKFSFDSNGDGVYEPRILIVKDGTLQPF